MERSERSIPGNDSKPEQFVVNDSTNNVSFTIREASDEQLQHSLGIANQQFLSAQTALMDALNAATSAAGAVAVFSYEIDRRSRRLVGLNGGKRI